MAYALQCKTLKHIKLRLQVSEYTYQISSHSFLVPTLVICTCAQEVVQSKLLNFWHFKFLLDSKESPSRSWRHPRSEPQSERGITYFQVIQQDNLDALKPFILWVLEGTATKSDISFRRIESVARMYTLTEIDTEAEALFRRCHCFHTFTAFG